MLEHELSIVIHQERERAIQDARMHLREGMHGNPSPLRRVATMVARVTRRTVRPAPIASSAPAQAIAERPARHGRPSAPRITPG